MGRACYQLAGHVRPSITALRQVRENAAISELPHITFVLGGARSGKSRHAEQLVTGTAAPWVYLATAQILDDEMRARVAEHQARREPGWHTIEAPIDLADALARAAGRPVLVDCLTIWLSNLILGGHDIAVETKTLEMALDRRDAPTVLVGNEVGLGIVPDSPLGRTFRDAAGRLNQRIAARADRVVFMVAGLPLTMK
jgi:adenosylcobinamide kinase/adenosylcobinamide-phosphate guanylyltransferase